MSKNVLKFSIQFGKEIKFLEYAPLLQEDEVADTGQTITIRHQIKTEKTYQMNGKFVLSRRPKR